MIVREWFFRLLLDFLDKSPKRKIYDDKYMSWLNYLLLILDYNSINFLHFCRMIWSIHLDIVFCIFCRLRLRSGRYASRLPNSLNILLPLFWVNTLAMLHSIKVLSLEPGAIFPMIFTCSIVQIIFEFSFIN